MKDLFVSYEQAVQLKELGFNDPCLRVGNPNGHTMWKFIDVGDVEGVDIGDIMKEKFDDRFVEIPLKQQTLQWFREKYGYFCEIFVDDNKTFGFLITYFVEDGRADKPIQRGYNSYEEAESVCIDKLIEIIKTKSYDTTTMA